MPQFLAIVAYRCIVGDKAHDSLDVQVQWFDVENAAVIRELINAVPIQSYKNSDDELVSWELTSILEIEPFTPQRSGDEVIGFIASTQELNDLAS